jgi:hypothetical protein
MFGATRAKREKKKKKNELPHPFRSEPENKPLDPLVGGNFLKVKNLRVTRFF